MTSVSTPGTVHSKASVLELISLSESSSDLAGNTLSDRPKAIKRRRKRALARKEKLLKEPRSMNNSHSLVGAVISAKLMRSGKGNSIMPMPVEKRRLIVSFRRKAYIKRCAERRKNTKDGAKEEERQQIIPTVSADDGKYWIRDNRFY